MIYLKQSTAATIKLGPFVDSGDGVTAETGLTIQKADVRLSKNGGNMAAAAADQGESDAGAAHDELGYYDISLGTGDTDTLGRLKVMVSESGALPVWAEYEVVPANVFDSIVAGTDKLDTNAAEMANGVITAAAIATDAIDADALKADAITEIQNGLATPTNITAGTITTVTNLTNAPTNGDLTATMKSSVTTAATAATPTATISTGTGAGQLDITSGVVKANLAQILGTALTETSGLIAAAFKKFFNVATPTGTVNSLPDAVPAANGGLPTTNGTKLNQTADLTSGQSIAVSGEVTPTAASKTGYALTEAYDAAKTAASQTSVDALNDISTSDVQAIIDVIAGATWTDETLEAIKAAVDAVEAGTAPTVEEIDTQLSSTHGSGAWGGAVGSGAISRQWPKAADAVQDDDGNLLDGAAVWVTSDEDGNTGVAGPQYTQSNGLCPYNWLLDGSEENPVTYYGWVQLAGYTFDNPTEFIVPDPDA